MKFGRPTKLTDSRKLEIYSRRMAGATIGQLAEEFNLGEATIYRAIKAGKRSGALPEKKTTKVILWLQVENNNKFVRGKGKSRHNIEDYCLVEYNAKKLDKDGWEYELAFQFTDEEDLENQIDDLVAKMSREADPFGMRLEQGKHLLIVRNTFAPEHPTVNLVDLPTGMFHEIIQYAEPGHGERIVRADLLAGLLGPCQITLRQVQIGTMGLFNPLLFPLLFAFIFRSGVLEPLYLAVLPFE